MPRVQELNSLLDTETLRDLRRRPVLLRELLAELAALNPRLLRAGIDVLGVELPSLEEASELAATLQLWAAQAPELASDSARAFGVATEGNKPLPTRDEWMSWLWQSGSDRTRQLLLALLRTMPPHSDVLARLADLYRREVQRRIVRAEAARAA